MFFSAKVNHLLYADDLILFSATPHGLRRLIMETERWAAEHNLEINSGKTEVAVLHAKTRRNADV